MNSVRKQILVSYVPSPHGGYLKFFRNYPNSTLYILGKEFIDEFSSLTRNLPGDEPEDVQKMIESLHIFDEVHVLNKENFSEIKEGAEIIMPDEEVSRGIAEKYLTGTHVTFDNSWKLRWHWDAVVKKELLEETPVISVDAMHQKYMRKALEASSGSSDWWRQVGGVVIKDGEMIIAAYNKHFPSEQSAYIYGDPRSNFDVGKNIEVSSALHAEIGLISEAARKGISMQGADLYVSTFPCPPCAYACANTGIKRLFYSQGYSLLEGAEALRSRGVELIRVDLTQE